jgi:hypothetical protein
VVAAVKVDKMVAAMVLLPTVDPVTVHLRRMVIAHPVVNNAT